MLDAFLHPCVGVGVHFFFWCEFGVVVDAPVDDVFVPGVCVAFDEVTVFLDELFEGFAGDLGY